MFSAVKSFSKEAKETTPLVLAEIRHYLKVSMIALCLTTSVYIGLPSISLDNGLTIQMTTESFLALVVLIVGLLALSEWLRREN